MSTSENQIKGRNKSLVIGLILITQFILYSPFQICSTQEDARLRNLLLVAFRLQENKDFESAEKIYKEAVRLSIGTTDKEPLIICYFNLAEIAKIKKNYDEAKQYLDKALTIIGDAEPVSVGRHRMLILADLGMLHMQNLVDHDLAIKYLKEAIAAFHKAGYYGDECDWLYSLAGEYLQVFNYQEAKVAADTALTIALSLNDKKRERNAYYIFYGLFRSLDDYDRAAIYLNRVIKIDQESNNKADLMESYINIGDLLIIAEDNENAREFYEKAFAIALEEKNLKKQANLDYRIGQVLQNENRYDESLDKYLSALDYETKYGYRGQQEFLLRKVGYIWLLKSDWQKSVSYFEKALKISYELDNMDAIAQDSLYLGIAHLRNGNENLSLKYIYSCEKIFSSAFEQVQDREEKATYADKRILPYDYLIEILYRQSKGKNRKKQDEAFCLSEKAKAKVFTTLILAAQSGRGGIVAKEDLEYEKSLYKEIERLRLAIKTRNRAELKSTEKLIDEYTQYEMKLDAYKTKLAAKNTKYANIKYPELLSIERVQKELIARDDEAILEYYVGEEGAFLFVITRKKGGFIKIDISKNELTGKIYQLRSCYKEYSLINSAIETDISADIELAQHLYQVLIKPAESYLRGVKNIIIVPHGCLNYLPFEMLVSSRQEEARKEGDVKAAIDGIRFIIEDYSISYVPSLTSVNQKNIENTPETEIKGSLLAIGNPSYADVEASAEKVQATTELLPNIRKHVFSPLPYSSKEIEEISQYFIGPKIYTEQEATKKSFIEEYPHYKNIHLATHGYADEDNPLFSGIVFAHRNDISDADILYAYEIFNLNLASDLITISACETGLGQNIGKLNGEGVSGLQRAFLFSGAKSLLLSLWNVEDESTSILMREFYRYNIQGKMGKAEALRGAKLSLMKMERKVGNLTLRYSSPFFWAPFVLIGNPN